MHTCICICMRICISLYTYTHYTHTYMQACIHAYIHIGFSEITTYMYKCIYVVDVPSLVFIIVAGGSYYYFTLSLFHYFAFSLFPPSLS